MGSGLLMELTPHEMSAVLAFVRILREQQRIHAFTMDEMVAAGCMFGMLHAAGRAVRDANATEQTMAATPVEALQQFAARTRQLAFDLAREHGAEWEALLSKVDVAHPLPRAEP